MTQQKMRSQIYKIAKLCTEELTQARIIPSLFRFVFCFFFSFSLLSKIWYCHFFYACYELNQQCMTEKFWHENNNKSVSVIFCVYVF